MSLSPRLDGFAVPDTPLFRSVIKPATVNSRKNTEQTRARRKTHRPLASIIYPPCQWFPGNCRFWRREKNSERKQEKCILQ